MRLRSTLILALLLVGLAAYVYLVELPKTVDEDKKDTLFALKAEEVGEILLEYPDRKLHLRKADGQWRLTEPVDAEADGSAIESLLSTVTTTEIKKKLDGAGNDLARFGLDKPLVTLTLQSGDKPLAPVSIGKDAPVGGSLYLIRKDEPNVLLAASSLRLAVDKQVKDLRDKKIVSFGDDEVKWIEVHGERKDIRAVKGDGDKWAIERPEPFAADASALRTYVASVRALRVVDFIHDAPTDLASYGLDQPRLKVSVGLKDDSVRTILFGNKQSGGDVLTQLEGKPAVYTVSDSTYRTIDKSVRDLRDKMILTFEQGDAVAIQVQRKGNAPYRLVKGDAGAWTVEGNPTAIKPALIDQFVTDLHELKAYEIVGDNPTDLAPLGLNDPLLRISVSGKDGLLGTVIVGETDAKDGTKNLNTMREGAPTVYLLRGYVFTRLNKAADDFTDKPTPAPTPAPAGASK